MIQPVRLRMSRKKGFSLQEHSKSVNGLPAVLVTRTSRWGNPFVVGRDGTAKECVTRYAAHMLPYTHRGPNNALSDFYLSQAVLEDMEISLRGKNLACYCPIECSVCTHLTEEAKKYIPCPECNGSGRSPCHADWLLKVVNKP